VLAGCKGDKLSRRFRAQGIMIKTFLAYAGVGLLLVSAPGLRSMASGPKTTESSRALTGRVFDRHDQPVHKAIVYLKNTKSLAVKTYITDPDGSYRFPGLSPNVDYEVYAESNGARSDTKTLSAFDTRKQVSIALRIK
jgi:Carboxypeptidase regulatory-like domain